MPLLCLFQFFASSPGVSYPTHAWWTEYDCVLRYSSRTVLPGRLGKRACCWKWSNAHQGIDLHVMWCNRLRIIYSLSSRAFFSSGRVAIDLPFMWQLRRLWATQTLQKAACGSRTAWTLSSRLFIWLHKFNRWRLPPAEFTSFHHVYMCTRELFPFYSDYSRIMLGDRKSLLFLKLCRHNKRGPNLYGVIVYTPLSKVEARLVTAVGRI